MGKLTRKLFGGKDKNLQREIREDSAEAKKQGLQLFASGEKNREAGIQGALDVFAQTTPHQFDALKQGGIGAQSQLIDGLRSANDAILGNSLQGVKFNPVAPSFNPNDIDFDRMPENISISESFLHQSPDDSALAKEINTDADLFRLAGEGRIFDAGKGDRKFFLRMANSGQFDNTTRAIDDPLGFRQSLVSEEQFEEMKRAAKDSGLPEPEVNFLSKKNMDRVGNLLGRTEDLLNPNRRVL